MLVGNHGKKNKYQNRKKIADWIQLKVLQPIRILKKQKQNKETKNVSKPSST